MEEERCVYKVQIYLNDMESQESAEFYIEDFDGDPKVVEKVSEVIKRTFVKVRNTFSSKVNLRSYRDNIINIKIDICRKRIIA